MNYRHIYHAGCFADLMKHLILVALLKKLQEKDKGFTVLDAFAGLGIYDLDSEEAQKNKEYENGIGMLNGWIEKNNSQPCEEGNLDNNISAYLSIIEFLSSPSLYPGSPYIISSLLRQQDELIASELHPQDYATLKHNMRWDNSAIHHIDGYLAIKAFLPPKNSRGLVLLDSAFEVQNEYLKIIDALKLIKKRFAAGIVMVWYPMKDAKLVQEFYKALKSTDYPEFLKIEFEIDNTELGMNKCGVIITNPPYIQHEIRDMMQLLCDKVYNGAAKMKVEIF